MSRVLRRLLGAAALMLAAATGAGAADYCIDAATGSDGNSGTAPGNCWAGLGPSQSFPFAAGDRVLIAEGRYVHPLTAWYMKPGVSWIGAGREATVVVYDKNLPNPAPFVRFRTGSGGSGPPSDLRPGPFGPTTVFSDMTLLNEGNGAVGVDVEVSSADSSPTIERVAVDGFTVGIRLHPTSDERANASTGAILSQNVIRDAGSVGVLFFPDVFYARTVTEASTMVNTTVQSNRLGVDLRTFISYASNFDPADVVLNSVLTHGTIVGGSESALRLVSYLDDGTGERLASEEAGTWAPSLTASIFTGSGGHGIEETSAFTEPGELAGNALGGNSAGDYLDEGASTVPASAVGVGNLTAAARLVDVPRGDLHQLSDSPTVDLIAAAGAPPEDVDGQARPQGGMADIGADEYFPCSAVADTSASVLVAGCAGGTQTLDATRSTADAACTEGLLYEWWLEGMLVSTEAVFDIVPDVSETWRLVVRCADPALSACFDETTVDVEPNFAPPTATAGEPDQACADEGDSILFTLAGTAEATPPATLVSTTWSAPEGLVADPSALSTTIELTAGAVESVVPVTLEALDSNGCTAQSIVMLTVSPNPRVTIEAVEPVCHDPAAVDVDVPLNALVEGGTGALSFDWSSSEGSVAGDAAATLSLVADGSARMVDVSLTVTDERGCSADAQLIVIVQPAPLAVAGADLDECRPPGTASVALDGTASEAAAGSTWEWTTSAGTVSDPSASVTELLLDVSAASQSATVTLTLTTPDGLCASVDSREVTLRLEPVADPGGPYSVVRSGGATNELALDGTASLGGAGLSYAWTTDLGTFLDSGGATSALPAPTLVVPDDPANVQRAAVCLTVSLPNGCVSAESCTQGVVLLEAVDPPNDVGWTLRLAKSEPDEIVLSWADAPEDADHDLADRYQVRSFERACGPFGILAEVVRVPGTNSWPDPILASPPPLRFYEIVSVNDGGLSEPLPPDGTGCP